ncbi:MAG: TrbC/VirB2 family protein [Rickettsiales bacterium]|nr:TrbC/VirB2 family protein [Pseudomonadota bacterium]MDG4546387.1 TrbC/VirB2 family protein [Rickettsiales bacterium]
MNFITKTKEITSYCKARFNLDSGTFGTTFTFMLLALVALAPNEAMAADAEGMGAVVCNIIDELQGPVARGVAAFGIIFLGFSLFLGKITWGVALALGIGIAAIFGAETIVDAMLGDTGSACSESNVIS